VAATLLAGLAAGIPVGGLRAQELAEPSFRAEARGDAVLVHFRVPEDWALYAPTASETPPGAPAAGRPLRIFSRGRPVLPSSWPEPVVRPTALGRARVHEAGRYTGGIPVSDLGGGEIEIEWALCSDVLCVPGRSRVPVRPAP
jgi:hypothetical protein